MTQPLLARGKYGSHQHEMIDRLERGYVFWVDMPPEHVVGGEQHHEGPTAFLIVSPGLIHRRLPIVQAVPLTTTSRDDGDHRNHRIRLHPPCFTYYDAHTDENLFEQVAVLALTEQCRVLAHERLLGNPAAKLDMLGLGAVEAGLRASLGIPPLEAARDAEFDSAEASTGTKRLEQRR